MANDIKKFTLDGSEIKVKEAECLGLGNEAVSGQPYHFPYHIGNLKYDTTDSKLKGTLFTITLDNKTLTQYPLEVSIPQGSGEPTAYIKSASVSGNTLTLTKKDDSDVAYTPTIDLSAYSTTEQMNTAISAHHDSSKQDVINDEHKLPYAYLSGTPTIPESVTESTVSGWGFTKNTGTITGIKMNGTSKGTSGEVDLGTVITSHQDISGKLDASKSTIQTTAPTEDITDGGVHIVYLETEPTTKYNGYIYLIKE